MTSFYAPLVDVEPFRAQIRRVARLVDDAPLPAGLEWLVLHYTSTLGQHETTSSTDVAVTVAGWQDTPRGRDVLAGTDTSPVPARVGFYRPLTSSFVQRFVWSLCDVLLDAQAAVRAVLAPRAGVFRDTTTGERRVVNAASVSETAAATRAGEAMTGAGWRTTPARLTTVELRAQQDAAFADLKNGARMVAYVGDAHVAELHDTHSMPWVVWLALALVLAMIGGR